MRAPVRSEPASNTSSLLVSRKLRTVATVLTSPWTFRFRRGAAITASAANPDHVAACGQSGQRRSRAARHPWSESGGRGGVSDLGAASSPPRKRAPPPDVGVALDQDAESRPLRSQAPRCPMEQKRLKDTLGLTPERVSGVPVRGLEMCLAQAGSAPMARPQELRWSTRSTR